MTNVSNARVSTIWIMLLTLAGSLTSLALACAAPFEALAALAATQMRARDGVKLMLAVWVVNQGIGFGLHHYPQTPKTLLWGVAIGMAAVGCCLAARWVVSRIAVRNEIAQTAIAFAAAILGFKAVILAWALVLGGVATTLSPVYFAQSLERNGAILIGLYALYRLAVALGMPKVEQRARPALA